MGVAGLMDSATDQATEPIIETQEVEDFIPYEIDENM